MNLVPSPWSQGSEMLWLRFITAQLIHPFQTAAHGKQPCLHMYDSPLSWPPHIFWYLGWVLIDRSGKHFSTILNFLRDGSVSLPETKKECLELHAEAKWVVYHLIFRPESLLTLPPPLWSCGKLILSPSFDWTPNTYAPTHPTPTHAHTSMHAHSITHTHTPT